MDQTDKNIVLLKKQTLIDLMEERGQAGNQDESARVFWEHCPEGYAHLVRKKDLSQSGYRGMLREQFIDLIDWEDKIVVDYGCGAGFLGEYLFKNNNINEYIGVDISRRSVSVARGLLMNYNCDFYVMPIDFETLEADIFVSMSCIQHFPNEKYLINFLENINDSNINLVMLHIRHSDPTVFAEDSYISPDGNIGNACRTNCKYILSFLTNYKIKEENDILGEGSQHQYLIFERIKNEL